MRNFMSFFGFGKDDDEDRMKAEGMEFDSEMGMIESCLSLDLEGMEDSDIKKICSTTGSDKTKVDIKYISLEGAGDVVELLIRGSENWHKLPVDNMVNQMLISCGAYDHYDFEGIEEGYYTVSGVLPDGNSFDRDKDNIALWRICKIGIWDTYDETLYYISVTR